MRYAKYRNIYCVVQNPWKSRYRSRTTLYNNKYNLTPHRHNDNILFLFFFLLVVELKFNLNVAMLALFRR